MTLDNTDGEIAGLTISDPPTQGKVQALRENCNLADDVRALSTLVHALRGAVVGVGLLMGAVWDSAGQSGGRVISPLLASK